MLASLTRDRQKLDNLYAKISVVNETEMKAQWAKYLCVLTSGYLENSIRNIISDYAQNKASNPLANFIQKKVKSITNLKNNNLIDLLNSFDSEWGDKYKTNISDEQVDAINSIVANRHLIAHGRNVGITYISVKNYYDDIKPSVNLIYQIVNNEI